MVDGSWRSVGRDLPSRHEGEALLLGIRRGGRLSLLGGLLGLGRSLLLSLFGRLLLGLGGRSGLGLRGSAAGAGAGASLQPVSAMAPMRAAAVAVRSLALNVMMSSACSCLQCRSCSCAHSPICMLFLGWRSARRGFLRFGSRRSSVEDILPVGVPLMRNKSCPTA